MECFFPEVHGFLDYSYLEFLSQEIFADVSGGEKKYVDILVKTRLQGDEGVLLIHVEPQSEKQKDFAERMFRYYAILYLRHSLRILPIAVLSHGVKKEEPAVFKVAFPFQKVLEFEFLMLHLKRKNWREYLKKDNPVAAALMSCMAYTEAEKKRIKAEFLKMLLRLRLDPARMQLLVGFFEVYLRLDDQDEKEVQRMLHEELPSGEVKEVTEILTSYHVRGRNEGRKEALQDTLVRLLNQKLGYIEPETENMIKMTDSIPVLEGVLERIFGIDSEAEIIDALNQ